MTKFVRLVQKIYNFREFLYLQYKNLAKIHKRQGEKI